MIKNANKFRRTLRIWLTVGYPFQTWLDVQKDFKFGVKCVLKYGKTVLKPITIMSEPYHIFPGSPAFKSPEIFDINLKYTSFLQLERFFKKTKMSFFYNAINYDSKVFSQTSIRTLNMLLFLSTALTLLTTGSKFSLIKEKEKN